MNFRPAGQGMLLRLLGKIYFDENYEVFDEIEAYNWPTSCIGMHQKGYEVLGLFLFH